MSGTIIAWDSRSLRCILVSPQLEEMLREAETALAAAPPALTKPNAGSENVAPGTDLPRGGVLAATPTATRRQSAVDGRMGSYHPAIAISVNWRDLRTVSDMAGLFPIRFESVLNIAMPRCRDSVCDCGFRYDSVTMMALILIAPSRQQ